MASLTHEAKVRATPAPRSRAVVRDSVAVAVGGQLERALGTLTAFALRWGLEPASLGVYTGLRLYLDNTNRSSLGVGLGAVQEIPVLLAEGREAEARLVSDVAYTTNTLTCFVYAAALVAVAVFWAPGASTDPVGAEWKWGLAAVAGLALIKRYETFLVAVLRARGAFTLTAELDVVESLASAVAVSLGLWLAGFWGLLAAVGVLLLAKIAYAHARHPLRFRFAWDGPTAWRLMRVGLPILANTAAFGAVQGLDRALILGRVPDGARAVGLYSIALMGTGWALDLAGRLVLVSYNAFQTTLGRTADPREVARQSLRATEAQAPILLAGSAVAYLVGPAFLGWAMPKYVDGLPALRPLLPGMIFLGLAWPARQMLIAVGRPYRLFAATLAGLLCAGACGVVGADRAGIVGVAWAMSIGYAAVFLLTSGAAVVPLLGPRAWAGHVGRVGLTIAGFTSVVLFVAHTPLPFFQAERWALAVRCVLLTAWLVPTLWVWARRNDWGGYRGPLRRTG